MDEELVRTVVDKVSPSAQRWLPTDLRTTVALAVTGAPGGDALFSFIVDKGTIASPATSADHEVTVEIPWKDSLAIAEGNLQPAVAYMQGRLKPAGRMDVVLALLEGTTNDDFRSWLRDLRN